MIEIKQVWGHRFLANNAPHPTPKTLNIPEGTNVNTNKGGTLVDFKI